MTKQEVSEATKEKTVLCFPTIDKDSKESKLVLLILQNVPIRNVLREFSLLVTSAVID